MRDAGEGCRAERIFETIDMNREAIIAVVEEVIDGVFLFETVLNN